MSPLAHLFAVFLIPLFSVFSLLLYVVWRGRPKISYLPHGHQFQLLSISYHVGLLFLLSGVCVSLLIPILTKDIHVDRTTLSYLIHSLRNSADSDSWRPMTAAIKQIREHPDVPIYSEIFFNKHIKFQYPTSALLFLDFPQRIIGCSWERLVRAINLICWLCLPVIGMVFCNLFIGAARFSSIKKDIRLPASSLALLTLMSLAFVGSFYPLLQSYLLGQIQTPMSLFVGLALIAWQRRQFVLAGFLIGLCCGIKPQWVALIPWAILRQQWRMAIAALITWGTILSFSIGAYGLNNLLDYFPVLSFLSEHGESFFPNQSVNGLVNRLLFNGNNLDWVDNGFPSFHPVVYVFTIGSSILIMGMAMFWKMGKNPSIFDLALMILSLTIASPIAWEHHYGILLPILAIVLPTAISQQSLGAWTKVYLGLAFLLTGQVFNEITKYLANTHWNIFQSHLFLGAMMVLFILYRISYLQQRESVVTKPGLQAIRI